jgi:hypothetical protein
MSLGRDNDGIARHHRNRTTENMVYGGESAMADRSAGSLSSGHRSRAKQVALVPARMLNHFASEPDNWFAQFCFVQLLS